MNRFDLPTVIAADKPTTTGGIAITPVHAILNYCFALLESEDRLALSALGLDPGLGVDLHTDTRNRDSLALDVLEPVRPEVESWLLTWIAREPFRRADFFETKTGNCRITSDLCAKLSETAPTWGRLVAPWAEYVAQRLWAMTSRPKVPATRLTQQHRREAKGSSLLPPDVPAVRHENICRGCGKTIRDRRLHCAQCAIDHATQRLIDGARIGRTVAHTPDAGLEKVTSNTSTSSPGVPGIHRPTQHGSLQTCIAENPAAPCWDLQLNYRRSAWHFSLVRGPHSRRLPPTSTALADACGACRHELLREQLTRSVENENTAQRASATGFIIARGVPP